MLNPHEGEWHEQISEYDEYCAICSLDPNHPPIEPSTFHWLWILDDNDSALEIQHIICDEHRDSMFELFDQSQE